MQWRDTMEWKILNEFCLSQPGYNSALKKLVSKARRWLVKTPSATIMDLGCGLSQLATQVCKGISCDRLILVDSSRTILREARTQSQQCSPKVRVSTRCVDLTRQQPRVTGEIDLLLSSFTLHNFHKIHQARIIAWGKTTALSTRGMWLQLDYIWPESEARSRAWALHIDEAKAAALRVGGRAYWKRWQHHNIRDRSADFIQDERSTRAMMEAAGFRNIKIWRPRIGRLEGIVIAT
jgi:Methyltransferase domain